MQEPLAEEQAPQTETPMGLGRGVVTILLCLLFTTIGAFWIRAAIYPHVSSGMCEAVPPIPAVAVLVFLLLLRGVLGFVSRRFNLTRQQIITVYAFVSISVAISGMQLYRNVPGILAGARRVLDPDYPENEVLIEINKCVPAWLAPTNEQAVHEFWYSSPTGDVPWSHWMVPLLSIGLILALFYLVVICMLRLVYARWSKEERLIFPVAEFALEMVEGKDESSVGRRASFRYTLFWVGAFAALLINLRYIIPSMQPGWRMSAWWVDVGSLVKDPPFNAMGSLLLRIYPPVILGLAFLVPMDILFSIWFFTLLLKVEAILLCQAGMDARGLRDMSRLHGFGGYVAIAVASVVAARRHIGAALRRVFGRSPVLDPVEAGRWTVLLLVGGTIGLLLLMVQAGMFLGMAIAYLGMVLVCSLASARIRAQAGVPNVYMQLGGPQDLIWLFGGAFLTYGGFPGIAAMAILTILFHAASLAPHHADCLRMAERSGLGVRRWAVIAMLGVIVGLVLANLTHMTALYEHGALNAGTAGQGYMTRTSRPLVNAMRQGKGPDGPSVAMAGVGGLVTAALACMRRFPGFPLHPVGYVVACAKGSSLFLPIFLAWFCKWFLLKYFGGKAHRKARDFFLGLAMGHMTIAAVWGVLSAFGWAPTERYYFLFW